MSLNIYSLPVFYISLSRKPIYETEFKENGFTNVSHFKAVDMRGDKSLKNILKMLDDKLITMKNVIDLMTGELNDDYSYCTKSVIGCYLSHVECWKLGIQQHQNGGPPFFIVAEDDVEFRNIPQSTISEINAHLYKKGPVVVSSTLFKLLERKRTYRNTDNGGHFNIISVRAAEALLKNAMPVSIHVDLYMTWMSNIGRVHLRKLYIYTQRELYFNTSSSLGNGFFDTQFKKMLPASNWFYVKWLSWIIITALSLGIFIGRNVQAPS